MSQRIRQTQKPKKTSKTTQQHSKYKLFKYT
jgi:hypothetical protein